MPHFRYIARTPDGSSREGKMEAPSAEAVAETLQNGGAIPVNITRARPSRDWKTALSGLQLFQPRVTLDELILFSRQMYSLIHAGVPITRALHGIRETMRGKALRQALQEVIEDLQGGRQLSEAMQRQPQAFPPLMSNIVQTGEESGRLEQSFQELSEYLVREKETKQQIRSALRYPAFVLIAVSVALAVITIFVIPAFSNLFQAFDAELPWPTRVIISVSNFFSTYWYILLAVAVALFLGLRSYIGTNRGRYQWDWLKLRIPVIGSIVLRASLARFCRAFSMGYSSGVPVLQSIQLSGQSLDNAYIAHHLQEMNEQVERGNPLTASAESTGLFTPLVLQMFAVGEETGNVDTMLSEGADFYEREVDYEVKNLTSSIEPILIVIIGAMILVLALGVFLPMWELGTAAF